LISRTRAASIAADLRGMSANYSVSEYEEALRRGRTLSSSGARAFHEVGWTEDAPTVASLTTEWNKTSRGYFRIRDWDVYDAQMRELLGIT
jgi:hypothetical protein